MEWIYPYVGRYFVWWVGWGVLVPGTFAFAAWAWVKAIDAVLRTFKVNQLVIEWLWMRRKERLKAGKSPF